MPARNHVIAFGLLIRACIYKWCVKCESGTVEFRGPAYRILEKQNQLMINVRMLKKLDSSATSLAFQGF
jgi:hypothetical protein